MPELDSMNGEPRDQTVDLVLQMGPGATPNEGDMLWAQEDTDSQTF